jgi:hypothetical protein
MKNTINANSGKHKSYISYRRNGIIGQLSYNINSLKSLLHTPCLSEEEKRELYYPIQMLENMKTKLIQTKSSNVIIIKDEKEN